MRHSRILKAGVACDQTEEHSNTLIADQDTQWLPATTGTVLGIALNHADLREQMAEAFNEKPHVNPPKTPVLHIKTDNTHIGNGAAIPALLMAKRSTPALLWVSSSVSRRLAYPQLTRWTT